MLHNDEPSPMLHNDEPFGVRMSAANSLPWNDASIRMTLPIKTISENNAREHHMARHRRRSMQRECVHLHWLAHRSMKVAPPYVITLTRIAGRKLDSDNLQGSCKAIRDQVAKELGINDGDEAHEWRYDQRKPRPREIGLQVGGYGVEVRVESRR